MKDCKDLDEPCFFCGRNTDCTAVLCPHCGRSLTGGRNLWTPQMRMDMYIYLRQRFGGIAGYREAAAKNVSKALENIKEMFHEQGHKWITYGAIETQIAFAVRRLKKVASEQTPTFLHNKSAAHCAGFIGNKDMEACLECEWEESDFSS